MFSTLELKIPPVAQVVLHALGMWLVSNNIQFLSIPLPWTLPLSTILIGIGVGITLAGVYSFRAAKTTVNPTSPDTSSSVVSTGIYRYSRNPMYVGFLFILGGWAFYLAHVLAFLFLPVFVLYMNRFQIYPEEKAMCSKFGDEYRTYMDSVRRWI
jgi:protein-S-isoprenylcysteine O-methyltransferase Ste14